MTNPRTFNRNTRKPVNVRPIQPYAVVIPVGGEVHTMKVNATDKAAAIGFARQTLVESGKLAATTDVRFTSKAVKIGAAKVGDTYGASEIRAFNEAMTLAGV